MDRLSSAEREFLEQRHVFLELVSQRYPSCAADVEEVRATPASPLVPIVVESLDGVSDTESQEIVQEMRSGPGVVHVVPRKFERADAEGRHPLLALARRLANDFPLGFPVQHPMEGHPEAISRFGQPDGTLKIYNLPVEAGGNRYREQAETNEMFDSHNDGLGYAGLIHHVIFVLDSAPLVGGYTFFQNLAALAPALAASDDEAYAALFLPDAITAIRPRGKGAIKVRSPVFYIGRDGFPQVFFRVSTGEYRMSWREDDALDRAREFLTEAAGPFGPSSRFVHLATPGETVIVDNRHVVHGRTPFVDHPHGDGRVLARKWFVPTEADSGYRHVPAIHVDRRWASLFPEHFSSDQLTGEWHYDSEADVNRRVA
jgi:hypothetical protein